MAENQGVQDELATLAASFFREQPEASLFGLTLNSKFDKALDGIGKLRDFFRHFCSENNAMQTHHVCPTRT